MPEGSTTTQSSAELGALIHELEGQIETITVQLGTLRAMVTRLSAAAALSSMQTGTSNGAASNAGEAPELTSPPAPLSFDGAQDRLARRGEQDDGTSVTGNGSSSGVAWGVVDGASWPRAASNDEALNLAASEASSEWAWTPEPAPEPEDQSPDGAEASSPGEDVTGEVIALMPASEPETEAPRPLSSGWPDESAWSQSFGWPAMSGNQQATSKAEQDDGESEDETAAESPPAFDDASDDVSAIVARVWVELEADDAARREEVGRAVAEMRAELFGTPDGDEAVAESSDATPLDEEAARDEVRRAVEAARAELNVSPEPFDLAQDAPQDERQRERPSFPLAAPRGLSDWANMQVDVAGPPVIVMKDSEGRVELASVYEALNAIECGESAALLNYTPHSVTVGLPLSANVPSNEVLSGAIGKVFGRTCRIDSDGVRITVSIGDDPRRGSEDAA